MSINILTRDNRIETARIVYLAITTRDVEGIEKGTTAIGFKSVDRRAVELQIDDAYANRTWPQDSLRVIRAVELPR